jgi:hypothetical protein
LGQSGILVPANAVLDTANKQQAIINFLIELGFITTVNKFLLAKVSFILK